MLLLAVVVFRLFPERDVTVLNDGQSVRVSATFDARDEALEAASVSLAPGDRVLSGAGGKYLSLAVQRARPVVVSADGELVEVRTQATTVAGALADAGVDLRSGDRVYVEGKLAAASGPLFGLEKSRSVSSIPGRYREPEASDTPIAVSIQRARPVTVYIDTFKLETSSAAATVEDLLSDLGMTVREGDLVRPGLQDPVSAGMVVRLAKARTVSVILDGKEQTLYTQAQTVADVLAVLGVDPGPDEILSPPRDTPITQGLTVTIGLTRTVTEEVEEPVQPPTVYETDPNLPAGTTKVIPGTPGVRVTNYSVTYKNGVEVWRVLAPGGGITVEPIPTRHITGGKGSATSKPTLNAPGYNGPFTKKMTVRTTWYNASHGAWSRDDPNYGRTATGVFVDYGICAVDPSVIPLGTRFYVPDYGTCLAADTGGAIKGNIVDLGFPESAGDPGWGNPVVDIYILP
ncbi:MAG: ubiquitin-like domain-containing protein [Hyphomicrobiales bacterium]